ncbi:hypothetical protein MA04_04255 [Alcanivorax balearicus MACL04]|uniref:Transposase n=1 Tax=Alloalcanivorax balearicus MACL04 TaxID=1177182 RepID=A0ABT2R581_9GAMM|nr:transposase [Alloalcanivorax balearicus]MCU5784955.1 hypothetical protein [Alloalcanivorax balearicus MACL04]
MRPRRTAEQWHALIAQQRESGLPAKAFCQQHDLGYISFCNWRKRLMDHGSADNAESDDAGFVDVSSLMGSAQTGGTGWHIVLSLGNGVELRLSQNG